MKGIINIKFYLDIYYSFCNFSKIMSKRILFLLSYFKSKEKREIKILDRSTHLTSELCIEMVKVGLNPLIKEHYFKYLAYLDTPELVELWEDWKFELSEEQLIEIQNFVINELGNVPKELRSVFIHQYLMEFLPEMKVQTKDEKTKYLVNRIINDKPLYFKKHLSFFERLEQVQNKKNKKDGI